MNLEIMWINTHARREKICFFFPKQVEIVKLMIQVYNNTKYMIKNS